MRVVVVVVVVVDVGASVIVGVVASCSLHAGSMRIGIHIVHVQVQVLETESEQLPEVVHEQVQKHEQEMEQALGARPKMVHVLLALHGEVGQVEVQVQRHDVRDVPARCVQNTRVMHSSPDRPGAHEYLQNY